MNFSKQNKDFSFLQHLKILQRGQNMALVTEIANAVLHKQVKNNEFILNPRDFYLRKMTFYDTFITVDWGCTVDAFDLLHPYEFVLDELGNNGFQKILIPEIPDLMAFIEKEKDEESENFLCQWSGEDFGIEEEYLLKFFCRDQNSYSFSIGCEIDFKKMRTTLKENGYINVEDIMRDFSQYTSYKLIFPRIEIIVKKEPKLKNVSFLEFLNEIEWVKNCHQKFP